MSLFNTQLAESQPYVNSGIAKQCILKFESFVGHAFYRRPPPKLGAPPFLLHVGCGNHKFEKWINADFYNFHDLLFNREFVPDWMLDLTRPIRCPDAYWDGIFTEHALEHLTYSQCIFTLSEMHRILKPGAWIRIVLPDIAKYVAYYNGELPDERFDQFPRGPAAISNITQCWGHKSVWDAQLLCMVLH